MALAAKFKALGFGKLTQKHSIKVANIQGHEIRIMLLERSSSHAPHGQGWRASRDRRTETIAKIRITQKSKERAVVTAYIHYIQGPDGLQTLNPIISIGKTLPRDSLVFQIVMKGHVDQLRRLLAERRYTLRDRNTDGTPLLHVRGRSILIEMFSNRLYEARYGSTRNVQIPCRKWRRHRRVSRRLR